ncbi:MAG: hypothetical protein EAX86_10495 [Candidatus Heimdallarchaeota archaeon]|nr:hypothetical protein [Candidatus Heimdallarchaeota archaeon]
MREKELRKKLSVGLLILFIVLTILFDLQVPAVRQYSLNFASAKILRPADLVFLGGAGSFENRAYVNGTQYFTLCKWLVSDEWFFYTFNLNNKIDKFKSIPFPREKVSNETHYYFHGLTYSNGLFYTIGCDFWRNHTLIRFSMDMSYFEVSFLPIPELYLSMDEVTSSNTSTYYHKVGGIGVVQKTLWIYMCGYRPPYLTLTYCKMYGINLEHNELLTSYNLVAPLRHHTCMDEKGIFWFYYRNDTINGTKYSEGTLIGYDFSKPAIVATIKGNIHKFVKSQNWYNTKLGMAYCSFDYKNIVIHNNRVIFDDNPAFSNYEHHFNGFYIIPFF